MPSSRQPRQRRLALTTKTSSPSRVSKSGYATSNAQDAAIILVSPEAYGGEGALPVIWAHATKRAPEGQRESLIEAV